MVTFASPTAQDLVSYHASINAPADTAEIIVGA